MKKKTEILLTVISAIFVVGCASLSIGCSDNDMKIITDKIDDIKEVSDISDDIDGLNVYADISNMSSKYSCLGLIGCINLSGETDCCGNDKSSFVGCADCFGITESDDKAVNDYYYASSCAGCYWVSYPTGDEEDIVPVYGCYTKED